MQDLTPMFALLEKESDAAWHPDPTKWIEPPERAINQRGQGRIVFLGMPVGKKSRGQVLRFAAKGKT